MDLINFMLTCKWFIKLIILDDSRVKSKLQWEIGIEWCELNDKDCIFLWVIQIYKKRITARTMREQNQAISVLFCSAFCAVAKCTTLKCLIVVFMCASVLLICCCNCECRFTCGTVEGYMNAIQWTSINHFECSALFLF